MIHCSAWISICLAIFHLEQLSDLLFCLSLVWNKYIPYSFPCVESVWLYSKFHVLHPYCCGSSLPQMTWDLPLQISDSVFLEPQPVWDENFRSQLKTNRFKLFDQHAQNKLEISVSDGKQQSFTTSSYFGLKYQVFLHIKCNIFNALWKMKLVFSVFSILALLWPSLGNEEMVSLTSKSLRTELSIIAWQNIELCYRWKFLGTAFCMNRKSAKATGFMSPPPRGDEEVSWWWASGWWPNKLANSVAESSKLNTSIELIREISSEDVFETSGSSKGLQGLQKRLRIYVYIT